jgi:Rad3-related DNA helicase
LRIPDRPSSLGLHVPGDTWRPLQRETVEAVSGGNAPAVLLEAPTGFGKSLLAAAVARVTRGKIVIVTQTLQLQEQYLRQFPFMQALAGKSSFLCQLKGLEATAVNEAPCQTGMACKTRPTCPYFLQAKRARSSRVIITNYAKVVSSFLGRPDFLICDEGHLLERQILASYTIRLRYDEMAAAGFPVPPFGSIHEAANWATGKLGLVQHEMQSLELVTRDQDYIKSTVSRQRYQQLRAVSFPLDRLSNAAPTTLWSIEPYRSVMCIRPIWASEHVHEFFASPKRLLIQSATLDPDRVSGILGIKKYQAITLPSEFPVERRPIYYWPVAKMGIKSSDADLAAIMEAVDIILEHYPKSRGIIHSVNWTITAAIEKMSQHKHRLIVQPRGKKRAWGIDRFLATPHSVLVSPSVTTGLDGRFERARFQILPKLPFEDQSEAAIEERLETDPLWYAYQCAFQIQQATGRVMRDKTDYGETWILDEHFTWFYAQHRDLFSGWFAEALQQRNGP